MSDWLARMLGQLSDDFESLGGEGRIGLTFNVPVKVIVDGREVHSTVQVRWTEDGPSLPDVDGQARRIAEEARR